MYHDVSHLLSRLINGPTPLRQVYFASTSSSTPELAYQVDFPRLEIVLEGEFIDNGVTGASATLLPYDVLFVPAGSWNFPQWLTPVTTLSILFGKQQLGFSIVQWDGKQYHNLTRQHVARRGPRIGSFLLQTLNEMQMQPQEQQTARLIVASLLSHCRDLLGSQIQTASRSQALFEAIRDYIDERYASPLTRESVAQAFYISPNYLSHLFQKTGAIGFNEYLNHTRLEHAKTLLKGYELKIKEVAHTCGFVDSNYFCRLFRKNTERSPSEYRRQYHSQLTEIKANPK
ncbi:MULTISPECIES: AraC family transcriptional regulator [Citrobacter]|uniref:Helix-turn-helix transcriptional regulator n=1 Tax=Citrobacter braakii TaxID=57706 RepID=A0ABR6U1H6_CITBR|nr:MULTISPECIES: AraC family transcriptional regulator [Citrobacter]ELK6842783.1 helix-turn-helix transcriptional regulator [Citrobacter braakii]MBC2612669.1 helix-turn-helix transcriptional regulator [Citrobacter braakii]MBC2636641.1 helix-turn-helix transcriptional regulator [Citrobacter braakii]MBC2649360.1 helix-turn-helix transcriptional regulator [Citrobacter braakii]MDM3428201.1 AraC family transcriptional regulator [Citrobacter sp. Cb023]